MTKAQMKQGSLPSDQKTKSAGGDSVSHCSHHDKSPMFAEKEYFHCDECKSNPESGLPFTCTQDVVQC